MIETLNNIKKKLDELREIRKGSRLSLDEMQKILLQLEKLMEEMDRKLNGKPKKPD